MKRIISSYTGFTRTERVGVAGLCLVLAVVVGTYVALPYLSQPEIDEKKEKELVEKWEESHSRPRQASPEPEDEKTTQNRQPGEGPAHGGVNSFRKTSVDEQQSITNSARPSSESITSWFDPNTADSITLLGFGMRPVAISNLLKWRAKGKRFYKAQDLGPLYTLTEAEYRALEPHIAITRLQVDLNTADSITLLRLRGIGPKLAHKIIERRKHAPFTCHEQLRGLYDFQEDVFEQLRKELKPLGSEWSEL